MKKYIIFTICMFIISSVVLFAQTEKRTVEAFNKISVFGNIDVDLVKSDTFKININCQGGDLEQITSIVDDNELKISMLSDMFSDAKIIIRIYYKDLIGIEAKGGSTISSDMLIKADKLTLRAGGGGKLELYNLECNSINARATNGSTMILQGSVKKQIVDVSSKAAYSAFELESEEAIVDATAGGKAKITVTKYLEAKANAKGYIGYRGSPEKIDDMATMGGKIVEDSEEEEE